MRSAHGLFQDSKGIQSGVNRGSTGTSGSIRRFCERNPWFLRFTVCWCVEFLSPFHNALEIVGPRKQN
eukprot:8726788-Alexandrium_andersonii.AAC.1